MGRPLTGSLEHKDGMWVAGVPVRKGDRRRLTCSFLTKQSAQTWVTEQVDRLNAGLDAEPAPKEGRLRRQVTTSVIANTVATKSVNTTAVAGAAGTPATPQLDFEDCADVVPDAIASPDAHQLAAWMAQLAEARYASVDEAVAVWMAGDPFADPVHMRRYVEHCLRESPDGLLVWRFDGARLGRFVTDGVTSEQLWDAAMRLTRAPLLVRGAHSPFVTPDAAATFADRTGTRVVTIPDAAHDLGVERPEAVIDALDAHWAALR